MGIKTHHDKNFDILISFKAEGKIHTISFIPEEGDTSTGLKRMTLPELATCYATLESLIPEIVKKAQSANEIEKILGQINV